MALLASVLWASPAWAGELDPDRAAVAAFVKVDGELVEVDSTFSDSALHLTETTDPSGGAISSRLIGWDQWFGCFSLNHQDDTFALYTSWWDGQGKDVRLKCGTGDENSGWGYKHIRAGKEADWQAKLNAARAAGCDSAAQGVESWDDLMSGATASAVMWPEYRRVSPVNNNDLRSHRDLLRKEEQPQPGRLLLPSSIRVGKRQ
ncbi:hypothetical protein [Leifsonia sp. EB34]|uniref:hypothetical protein n=1 Tax=Leifsonia sp. EB34 TaxID=3156303 RepID=UPI003518AE9D